MLPPPCWALQHFGAKPKVTFTPIWARLLLPCDPGTSQHSSHCSAASFLLCAAWQSWDKRLLLELLHQAEPTVYCKSGWAEGFAARMTQWKDSGVSDGSIRRTDVFSWDWVELWGSFLLIYPLYRSSSTLSGWAGRIICFGGPWRPPEAPMWRQERQDGLMFYQ